MHGIIFVELEHFARFRFGRGGWERVAEKAGLAGQIFLPVSTYPDEEIARLVSAASELARVPPDALLEAFGEFLVPAYLKLYGHLVKPEWRALDLIEHVEETIHKVVRVKQPGAEPPEIRAIRFRDDEVLVRYASQRKLCPVLKGIALAVGKHYGEELELDEQTCMRAGCPECRIAIVSS